MDEFVSSNAIPVVLHEKMMLQERCKGCPKSAPGTFIKFQLKQASGYFFRSNTIPSAVRSDRLMQSFCIQLSYRIITLSAGFTISSAGCGPANPAPDVRAGLARGRSDAGSTDPAPDLLDPAPESCVKRFPESRGIRDLT